MKNKEILEFIEIYPNGKERPFNLSLSQLKSKVAQVSAENFSVDNQNTHVIGILFTSENSFALHSLSCDKTFTQNISSILKSKLSLLWGIPSNSFHKAHSEQMQNVILYKEMSKNDLWDSAFKDSLNDFLSFADQKNIEDKVFPGILYYVIKEGKVTDGATPFISQVYYQTIQDMSNFENIFDYAEALSKEFELIASNLGHLYSGDHALFSTKILSKTAFWTFEKFLSENTDIDFLDFL